MTTEASYAASQVVGLGVMGLTAFSQYYQSRFPDAKTIRLIRIPTMALTALSYAALGNRIGAFQNSLGLASLIARSTFWGGRNRRVIAATTLAIMAGFMADKARHTSLHLFEYLPLLAHTLGAASDYVAQGRYQRVFFLGRQICAAAYGGLSENFTVLAADVTNGFFTAKGAYQHDIKHASRTGSLTRDFLAYAHGIFRNSVTGASVKGQVSTDAGRADFAAQYAEKSINSPNPYFNV